MGQTTSAPSIGSWTAPYQFPLVPVAAAINPNQPNGLVAWSSWATDSFGNNPGQPVTQTAVFDIYSGNCPEYPVYTGHDMFCPGISFDFDGNLVVTGGSTGPNTSIFHSAEAQWRTAPEMNMNRGYQSSATLSDGRIFTIGGSWNDMKGGKDGEIFDGNKWTLLSGAAVRPMLTNDPQGIFRQDNHAWLFAWKGATVFQAGPSSAMNWYFPNARSSSGVLGSYSGAGKRANDPDAMCGTATMFDAVAGKILTLGGSPAYQGMLSTANAHLITIGTPATFPSVQKLASMNFPRIFATSTVLPDGSVLVVGGQSTGVPFSDVNTTLVPELWSPVTQQFTKMKPHQIPRNYHSFSILQEDARVVTGGGGLCGDGCPANHFDAEVFTPPYLFKSDGVTPADRPVISSVSSMVIGVGKSFTATLNSNAGTITWSLIRLGSSTHTVNTDQRRVPLVATSISGNTFTFVLPGDAGIVIPGFWYLFAMRNGVPSVAKTVKITL